MDHKLSEGWGSEKHSKLNCFLSTGSLKLWVPTFFLSTKAQNHREGCLNIFVISMKTKKYLVFHRVRNAQNFPPQKFSKFDFSFLIPVTLELINGLPLRQTFHCRQCKKWQDQPLITICKSKLYTQAKSMLVAIKHSCIIVIPPECWPRLAAPP